MSTVDLHPPAHPHGTRQLQRTGGVAGLVMLPLFAIVVVVLTWAEWDFLHGLGWTVLHAHDVNYPAAWPVATWGLSSRSTSQCSAC